MTTSVLFFTLCLAACSPRLTDTTVLADTEQADTVMVDSTDSIAPFSSWRIALQGGVAYRIGKMPSGIEPVMEQHIKNTRKGFLYGADVTYFFSEHFGLGAKFQNCYSGDKMPASATDNNTGEITNGYLENYENLWFAGPMFTFRLFSRDRNNAFYARAGLGAAGYSNWGRVVKQTLTYQQTGATLGLMYEVGYDLGISKHLSLGASITLQNAILSTYNEKDYKGNVNRVTLDTGKYESLNYIGLTLGLRYNL